MVRVLVHGRFEPWLKFVEEAVRVVRELALDHITVWDARILHQLSAAPAIDINTHVAPIDPRTSQAAQQRVGGSLTLERRIIRRAARIILNIVPWPMNFAKRTGAKEFIIIRKVPRVMTRVAIRGVEGFVIWAASVAA